MIDNFDIAQICENGHIVNDFFRTYPLRNKKFCKDCGSPTITACRKCRVPIQGGRDFGRIDGLWPLDDPPSYCPECGYPYPWTEKKISAAKEFIEEFDDLNEKDKKIFIANIDDLIIDTPRTKAAALKVKKVLGKLPAEAFSVAKGILINLLTSAAKGELGLK